MSYFWEDEVLYRQPSTDGELEPRIPLARNVSSSADVSFSVTESEHPSNRFSTERLLTAKMTSTIDAGFLGTIAETTTLTVELRPEQSDVLDYLYFYLHNTPPVADTLSQLDLPLDQVKPTSSTLYNYDTNRDAQPGLAVVASDAVGETDPTKYQNWVTDALATTTIDGRMSLYLASAAANFATGMYIVVQVTVKDLDPGTGDTVILPQRESAGFISGSTWTLVSIHYPELTYTIAGGHKLEMTVQISTLSEASGMLAYDTDSYIAFLMVPTVP